MNVSDILFESIKFVSCGKSSPQNTPGISMLNSNTITFIDVTLSGNTTGALSITSSDNIVFHEFSVVNNFNTQSANASIIQLSDSNIIATGTTIITKNNIGGWNSECEPALQEQMIAVFHIENSNVTIENLVVSENTSPGNILRVSQQELSSKGNWTFEKNRVCSKGSLFLDGLKVKFNGSLTFTGNTGNDESTSGIFIRNSDFTIYGDLSFLLNKGNIVSIHSVTSNTSVIGSLNIIQNIHGKRGVFC